MWFNPSDAKRGGLRRDAANDPRDAGATRKQGDADGRIKIMIKKKKTEKPEKWPCAGGSRRLHFEAVNRGAEG
jgi:hypothetical protein